MARKVKRQGLVVETALQSLDVVGFLSAVDLLNTYARMHVYLSERQS